MDGVNVAHTYVRSEGNILRRALPAAEFADILHFELCWLDGTQGDRVVPHLHLLGRGNVYVVITTTNVHFVARVGVDPTVATLPLCEIRQVDGKGPVPARFFHSHIHGVSDAMRVAKCFEIQARRKRPGLSVVPGATTVAERVPAMTMTARPTQAVMSTIFDDDVYPPNAPSTALAGPVTESDQTPQPTTGKLRSIVDRLNASMTSWRAPVMSPKRAVPAHPTSVRSPAVDAAAPDPANVSVNARPPPSKTFAGAFDVRAALADANERALDRIQHAVIHAAQEAEKHFAKPTKLGTAGLPGLRDALVPENELGVSFLNETVSLVSVERGSQVLFQLESAVVVAHGREAARDATARDISTGIAPYGLRNAAAEAAETLAATLPVTHLSCLDDFEIVLDAADDAEGGVAPGPVQFAADMARLLEHVVRDENGELEIRASTSACGGEDEDAMDDARGFNPETAVAFEEPGLAESGELESGELVVPGDASARLAVSSRVVCAPPVELLARLARTSCVAAPLMPALAVAVASLEAARVRREIEEARDERPDPTDDDATHKISFSRLDFDRERALFTVLERAMLAPRRGATIGGGGDLTGIVVERLGAFETDDLCAAAAMAEHAKRSHAIRRLALGSTKLFDVVARRLTNAAFEATHPHPALRRRRAFRDDKNFSGVANWARLVLAARQGAAAQRAVSLFHWTKTVLARSHGAPFERLDLATRESGALESIVQAAFIWRPMTHGALRGHVDFGHDEYSENEWNASLESDAVFHKLRPPTDGCTETALDMAIDTLHECVSVATHAHLLGGGDGWNTPKHAVAHHVVRSVPPRDVRPKVAAIFQRMVNVLFEACPVGSEKIGVGPRGANAVRAFRCAVLLRHLIEGSPDSMITKCIRDEYDVELKHVFTRRDVYERTTRPGDEFYEKHARVHFNWVMREVCPDFGKAHKETSQADALALWREEMMAKGQSEIANIDTRVEASHRRGALAPAPVTGSSLVTPSPPLMPPSDQNQNTPSPQKDNAIRAETNENVAPPDVYDSGVGEANQALPVKGGEDGVEGVQSFPDTRPYP
jgi:hypothetical protein